MASEELEQKYPNAKGQKIGNYEAFECQLVTINQFAEHGILPNKDYGPYKTQKCDTLIISRVPDVHAVVIGEHKQPGQLTPSNWQKIAKDLLETKCKPTDAAIGYVTDGILTFWINGKADTVQEMVREDAQPLPARVEFKDKSFVTELNYIISYFNPVTNIVKSKTRTNPQHLAGEVWQTIWRLRADSPEDCLATFVELFVFKFLDDLGLLKKDTTGADVSLEAVMNVEKDKSFSYYWRTVRPYIKSLFPDGKDGFSVINGIVLQSENRDHNIIFHEIMRKFIKFGSLKNTESDFKRRLYESFLQESKTTSMFGQFLTPRVIVSAIHDMAQIETLTPGTSICDPAAGVGGFILEQMARDLSAQWTLKGTSMKPVHKWTAWEIVPKTAILSKANALVHCGDAIADHPFRLKPFAKWLNEVFLCHNKTALGALETMVVDKFDLILTNPPFVVSGSRDYGKIIKSNNKRSKYYGRKYSGVEGLFLQFIINALKPNGEAWVLLPETFFLRTTDRTLRAWLFFKCQVDFLAILPERTFFNTPKRVIITHLKKRPRDLSQAQLEARLWKEKTLLFAVSEIGETRDAKRFPCASELPEMVQAYKTHRSGILPEGLSKRVVAIETHRLYDARSLNIRHYWQKKDAIELGLIGASESASEAKKELNRKVGAMKIAIDDWEDDLANRQPPPTPVHWRAVRLRDEGLFKLTIGRRVLKKEIYQNKTSIPLYSANIRKPFGYVHAANAGKLPCGGALWSIDSDFDCRSVAPGEIYSITDHCGQIELLTDKIDPSYLARQIFQAGMDQGFNREYRPSLGVFSELEVELPVTDVGEFDIALMLEWSKFQDDIERKREEIDNILVSE